MLEAKAAFEKANAEANLRMGKYFDENNQKLIESYAASGVEIITLPEAEQAKVKLVGETLNKQVKEAESRVRELESEMESFKEGSKEQADAIGKLQAAVGELRAVQQFANAKLELEKARALRETYFAIKDAVRRFAEKEGYDYILLDDSVPEMDPDWLTNLLAERAKAGVA